jgi:hypothetical protein
VWGTYYGGSEAANPNWDFIYSCAVDTSGFIYFAGQTSAPDYISSIGSCQYLFGGVGDLYLVKFTPGGQRVWGTYYGGSATEQDPSCTVRPDGYVYLSGTTWSSNNIATPGAYQQNNPTNLTCGLLACFDLNGQRIWGTYFYGSFHFENINGCVADTGGNVYLYGWSSSPDGIGTAGTFQPSLSPAINCGFLEKFTSTGNRTWGTYYGVGGSIEQAAVDDSGYIFITGSSDGQYSIVGTPGAYSRTFRGVKDAYLAKFDGNGQRIWGT